MYVQYRILMVEFLSIGLKLQTTTQFGKSCGRTSDSVGRQATGVKSDSLSIGRAHTHTQPSWKSFVCAIKTDNIGLDDIKSYVARRHLYSKNPAYFIVLLVYSEIFFCSTRAQHGTAFLRFFICK